MFGYNINYTRSSKEQNPLWTRRLKTKIKAAQREISQLSEFQKGAMKRKLPKKYNKVFIPEAVETAKQ